MWALEEFSAGLQSSSYDLRALNLTFFIPASLSAIMFEKVYSVGPQTCVMYVNHLAQYETRFGTLNEWQLLRR